MNTCRGGAEGDDNEDWVMNAVVAAVAVVITLMT